MKKIPIVAILMMMCVSPLFAVHTILRNASNLTSGILPNERVDDSSITQRGSTPLLVDGTDVVRSSHIFGGFSGIVGFETVFPTNTQRGAFLLNGFGGLRASHTIFTDFSTGVIRTDLALTGVATGTLRVDLALTGVATGTLRTDLAFVGQATGTLNILKMDNGTRVVRASNTVFNDWSTGTLQSNIDTLSAQLSAKLDNNFSVVHASNAFTGQTGGLLANTSSVIFASHTATGQTGGLLPNSPKNLTSSHTVTGISGSVLENSNNVVRASHTFFTDWSTTTLATRLDNVATDTTTITTRLNNGAVGANDEGTFKGNSTMFDFVGAGVVASQVGGTTTVTIAGGGQSRTDWDLYVGTPGTPNVDTTIENTAQWDLTLASFSMRGLSLSATAQLRVFFKSGTYVMTGATIPAGCYVMGGSSVVWKANSTVNSIVMIYGVMDNIKFDGGGLDVAGRIIGISGRGKLTNYEIYGVSGLTAIGPQRCALGVVDATGYEISYGKIADLKSLTGVAYVGDNAGFKVERSSNGIVMFNRWKFSPSSGNGGAGMSFFFSSGLDFHNNELVDVDQSGFAINEGCTTLWFHDNTIKRGYRGDGNNTGVWIFASSGWTTATVSTGVVISNNYISYENTTQATAFVVFFNNSAAAKFADGVIVKGNIVFSPAGGGGGGDVFIRTIANSRAILVQDNTVRGLVGFITDTGAPNLVYQSVGNIFGIVEQ